MSSPAFPDSRGLSFEAFQELQRLQHITVQITHAIPTLLRYQINAYTRANALKSATRGLPPEILSMIFDHACMLTRINPSGGIPGYPDQTNTGHYLITLSGVSSWWRQITLSSPRLWSYIRIGFDGEPSEGCLNLLRLYLARSGTMKLDIEIYFHSVGPSDSFMSAYESWPDHKTLIDPSVDSTIVNSLHRIRSLHLEGASVKWLSYGSQLSNLIRFTLSLNHPGFINDDSSTLALFTNSPNLYKLALAMDGSIDLSIDAHWSRITILTLTEVEMSICLKLLALCSNIEEYTSKFPGSSRTPGRGTSFSLPVTRSSLRSFSWEMWEEDDPEPEELLMFKNLHVPALKRLTMLIQSNGQQPNLRQFCSRLPQSISFIDLQVGCEPNEQVNSCIFKSFSPTLQTTEFRIGCLGRNIKTPHHALHCMMDPDFFQNLELLQIYSPSQWTNVRLPQHCGELIVQIIRARVRKKLTNGFRVKLEKMSVQWTPEKQGRLDALGSGWELDDST